MPVPMGVPGGSGRSGDRQGGNRASTAAPGARRPPARRHARRTTQVRRNAVVLGWIVLAAVLAVLVIGGPLASWGTWLPLHALLLGGIGSAITVWSAHFADTLLHRPALGGAVLLDIRLYAHGAGTLLVLTGITASAQALALAGVAVVVGAALTGVLAIAVQYRRAVAPRLAALAVHYAVALVLLRRGARRTPPTSSTWPTRPPWSSASSAPPCSALSPCCGPPCCAPRWSRRRRGGPPAVCR